MTHFNAWHDIEVGKDQPNVINAVIEIPARSTVKYELDKDTGMLKLDRHMYSAVYYPGDYGFVPKTLWDDGDPLDIMIFTNVPTYPMTLCEVKVIGVMRMIDGGEKDDKILAVHANDPRFAEWNDVKDIPQHLLKELTHFMETYKDLQGKKVKVPEVLGASEAYKDIKKGMDLYNEKFKQ